MMLIRIPLIVTLIGIAFCDAIVTAAETTADNDFYKDDADTLSNKLIKWLRDNGAYINDKLIVKNDGSYRGIFATQDMDAGEQLCSIPSKLIIQPTEELMENEDDIEATDCITIKAVMNAMSDSDDATPYGKYLAAQTSGYLPTFWSNSGKDLLSTMLKCTRKERLTESRATDYNPLDYDELPPHGVRDMINELKIDCNAGDLINNPKYLLAAMLVTSRADYDYMIPFYDMFNHDNAKYNIQHDESQENDEREIVSSYLGFTLSKSIKAGEELLLSYNRCDICSDRLDWFGTPEMWLQYGFVESIPQRWLFDFARVKFELEWKHGDESTEEVVVNFLVPMSSKGKRLLQEELTRLDTFADTHRHKSYEEYGDMSLFEWESLWQYYDALHNALTLATTQSNEESLSDEVWTHGHDWWIQDGTLKEDDIEDHYEGHYVLRTKRLTNDEL